MNKCVKIIVRARESELIQIKEAAERAAHEQRIEGTLYMRFPDHVEIIAVGSKYTVDLFIELFERDLSGVKDAVVEIEPAIKDRDYRGVFRIIQ